MSNWERRPLRESQMHYAALDAYILIEIFESLEEKLKEQGTEITEFKEILEESSKNKSKKNKSSKNGSTISRPKILKSELLEKNQEEVFKFYWDFMMKNVHNLLLNFEFDSKLEPYGEKSNILKDEESSKFSLNIFVVSNWERIFITKERKRYAAHITK